MQYAHDGSISVGHRENVLTLTGVVPYDVQRQIIGDTHVFGELDCSSKLCAGDIDCMGNLYTYRMCEDFNHAISSQVQNIPLNSNVRPIFDGLPAVSSNRIYAFGTDAWVTRTPRKYTPRNAKGIIVVIKQQAMVIVVL